MSSQYGKHRPTSNWDLLASLGHPSKFQQVSHLGSVIARHSSSGRQPKFATLNRGRHLHLAGRPSCWALAHTSNVMLLQQISAALTLCTLQSKQTKPKMHSTMIGTGNLASVTTLTRMWQQRCQDAKTVEICRVPQTRQQISAVRTPKFTILRGNVEEVSMFNKFFFRLSIHASYAKIQPDKVVRWCQNCNFFASCIFSEPRAAHFRCAF